MLICVKTTGNEPEAEKGSNPSNLTGQPKGKYFILILIFV